MSALTELEEAVLEAIARHVPALAVALRWQYGRARVISRENTGAGFYTRFEVLPEAPAVVGSSPVGDIAASVEGLNYGMGFLLWLKDGRIDQLEGYTYEESSSAIDLEGAAFSNVEPRA